MNHYYFVKLKQGCVQKCANEQYKNTKSFKVSNRYQKTQKYLQYSVYGSDHCTFLLNF